MTGNPEIIFLVLVFGDLLLTTIELKIVNSDGCGVRGTYWGRIVSGCGGPIRTEFRHFVHSFPQ
jgi:hypothetical protein